MFFFRGPGKLSRPLAWLSSGGCSATEETDAQVSGHGSKAKRAKTAPSRFHRRARACGLGNLFVRVFVSVLVILGTGALASARPTPPPRHPAVVRVVVPEGDSMSLGSGALVAINDTYGLVVTNWHVVRDGHGTATVIFPDGFRSTASVVRVDRDWDLAALVIWRPRVRPIPLGDRRPVIGEPLWIAGYGRGNYRISGGQCTHYLSPGGRLPSDMIELSTQARQGDSGGPILNQQGELAGVLFGASWGKTCGSQCLRVKQFLDPVLCRFDTLPRDDGTMLARRGGSRANDSSGVGRDPSQTPTVAIPASRNPTQQAERAREPSRPWVAASPTAPAFHAPPDPAPARAAGASPRQSIPPDAWEQGKTILAIIGLLAIGLHTLRWLGK